MLATVKSSVTENLRRGERPSVALLVETSNHYSRELLQGIRDYLRKEGHWALHLTEQGRGGDAPTWLAPWRGDGIIARIENRRIERAVASVGVPVVNLSASGFGLAYPSVITSSGEVAALAGEHLVERGLQHFAFCGDGRFRWSFEHASHFVEHVERAGFSCAVYHSRKEDFGDWEREKRKLGRWLRALPKPVGLMACYDIRGQQVLEVCRDVGVRVPDDIAVIGQHNDELLCNLCDPPLSSVIPNPRRSGYLAAELLDQLMRGRQLNAEIHRIPPIGVAVRHSSDIVAVADPAVSKALNYIRAHALERISVSDVLAVVPMSRTLLERRFRALLNRSPYEEIQLIRFRKAKELLLESKLSVAEVSERVGYSSPEYLSAIFKKKFGLSPRAFAAGHGRGKGKRGKI